MRNRIGRHFGRTAFRKKAKRRIILIYLLLAIVVAACLWLTVFGNVLLGRAEQAGENDADGAEKSEEDGAESVGMGETGDDEDFSGADKDETAEMIAVPETVSVLITQGAKRDCYRENVYLTGDSGLTAFASEEEWEQASAGETAAAAQVLDCADWMNRHGTDEMVVSAGEGKISLTDRGGNALASGYRGTFFIYRDGNGLRIVNELTFEDYLCGVVPGEMPESFASEAQKAQAVCARTYAARLAAEKKYETYGADLNDTTDCQVYLPAQENETETEAVRATAGEVLSFEGALADIYYFSTSCGLTSGLEVWKTQGRPYLQTVSLLTAEGELGGASSIDDFLRRKDIAAYDSESHYFRWTAAVDIAGRKSAVMAAVQAEIDRGLGRVGIEDAAGTGVASLKGLGDFSGLEVVSRSASGTITDLALVFAGGRVHLYHENVIRTVLGAAMTSLTDKNGEIVHTLNMLPSAAFSVDASGEGITFYGGGLGHGIGMSQYGADGMAKSGMDYEEILARFFPGTTLKP